MAENQFLIQQIAIGLEAILLEIKFFFYPILIFVFVEVIRKYLFCNRNKLLRTRSWLDG